MKKLLFILIFVFVKLLVVHGQANKYHPFPDSNSIWNEVYIVSTGIGYPSNYYKYTYFLNGDTTINSLSYHKVYYADSSICYYYGGYRELNKRLYFFSSVLGTCSEVILYDFNLAVGDIVSYSCDACDTVMTYTTKVSSIDSVMIADKSYRRRINFDWYGTSWIEGIGDTNEGVFSRGQNCSGCICWRKLVCNQQNSNQLYLNETYIPCFQFWVTTSEHEKSIYNYWVYPNPSNNKTTLTSTCDLTKAEIIVYDLFGQKVRQINNITGKTLDLHFDNLTSGVYYLKVTRENKIQAIMKIIINKN